MVKKTISAVFIFFLFICNINAIDVNITSEKYIMINLDEDRILFEKDSHDETQVASLTKIMTSIVAIENIDDFNEKVTIEKSMIDGLTRDIAQIGFKVGEQYTYDDLLYSMMLPSAADAANALAISIGGSFDKYLEMMNNKAMELGLNNTHYSNVFGLTDENNYSSAYDVSVLLRYALKNEKFRTIFTARNYTLTSGKKINSTIYKFDNKYIVGSKTGYTSKAGRCLASISNVSGANLMLVTINYYIKDLKYITETTNTYKYFEDNYSYQNIIDDSIIIDTIKTRYANELTYDIKVDKEYDYYLENNFDKSKLSYSYDGIKEVSSLDVKNKKLGTVKVMLDDEVIKEIDVLYDGSLTKRVKSIVFLGIYGLVIILFIVLLVYTKYRKVKRI